MPVLIIVLAITIGYYKEHFKSLESYSAYVSTPKISYELNTKDIENNNLDTLQYVPNVHSFTGLSFSTDLIGLSLSFQNEDDDKKHIQSSSLLDLQFFGKFKNHLWEIYYQNYQGLFISDEEVLENNLASANSWSYGISIKRLTNKNFKLKNSFAYFAKTKEIGWSPVIGLFYNKSKLFRKDGLIPTHFESNFDQLNGLTAIDSSSLGFDIGLTGLANLGPVFLGGLITVGLQGQQQYFSGIKTEKRTVTAPTSNVFVDLGYDTDKVGTIGFSIRSFSSVIPIKNAEFAMSRSTTSLYYKYFF